MKGGKPNEPDDKAALRLRDFEKARAATKKSDDSAKPGTNKKKTDQDKNKDPKDQDC